MILSFLINFSIDILFTLEVKLIANFINSCNFISNTMISLNFNQFEFILFLMRKFAICLLIKYFFGLSCHYFRRQYLILNFYLLNGCFNLQFYRCIHFLFYLIFSLDTFYFEHFFMESHFQHFLFFMIIIHLFSNLFDFKKHYYFLNFNFNFIFMYSDEYFHFFIKSFPFYFIFI